MRVAVRWLVALVVPLAAAPAAHALELAQALRAAAAHDAEFAAARAAREGGRARLDQAAALWRPTVVLEGGAALATNESATRGARFSAPGFGTSTGVAFDTSVTNGTHHRVALSLRQPLVDRDRRAQGRQLEVAAESAEAEWQAAQQALVLRTAERYFDVALAAERLRLLTRQQEAVDRTLVEARDRFRLGDRPVTDTHEAQARASALASQRLAAETDLAVKRHAFTDLTGLAEARSLRLPAGREHPALAPLGTWLAQAAAGNADLRRAEAQVRAAEAEQRRTDAALSPSLDLVARIGRDRLSGSGDFGSASHTVNDRAVGLQLAVPLYTGGWRTAQQAEARARLDEARAQLERVRRDVAQRVRAAWLDLSVGRSQEAALADALAASRARLDATQVGLGAGDRTTQDLLDAENGAQSAELALAEARVRLLQSRLRLAALAGQLDEATLAQADAALQEAR
jgi:outer membrane protein